MNSFERIRTSLYSFLKHPEPRVIAIKGAWGVGKTYCWREAMKSPPTIAGCNAVSYVSLFGLSSLDEIRRNLAFNRRPISSAPRGKKLLETIRWGRTPEILRGINVSGISGGALSGSDLISRYVENLALNEMLVCLDDLERREDHCISASALLGFITQLRDERRCKVVLLFNEDAPNGKLDGALQEYREKVIDYELKLQPTIRECYDIVFEDRFSFPAIQPSMMPFDQIDQRTVLELFVAAKVDNIRVMRRTHDVLSHFEKSIAVKYPRFWPRFIQHVVKLSVFHFVHGAKFSLEEIVDRKKYIELHSLFRKDKKEGLDATAKYKPVFDLEYHPLPSDTVIAQYLTTGHDNYSEHEQTLGEMEDEQVNREKAKKLGEIWDLLWDNFQATQREFIEAQLAFLKENNPTLSFSDISQVVSVLRQLGAPKDAEEILEQKIAHLVSRMDRTQLPMLHLHAVPDDIRKEIVQRVGAKSPEMKPIGEVLAAMTKPDSWTPSDAEHLVGYSADDFYSWLVAEKSPQLLTKLKVFRGRLGGEPNQMQVRQNIEEALCRIAARSDIDRLRVNTGAGLDTSPQHDAE